MPSYKDGVSNTGIDVVSSLSPFSLYRAIVASSEKQYIYIINDYILLMALGLYLKMTKDALNTS